MGKPQYIYDDAGNPLFAVVPADEYEALAKAAEELADVAAYDAAKARIAAGEAMVPADIVHRISAGEPPLRVWRRHRGITASELARGAGISQAYLSEIESGKKSGSFKVVTAIARALEIEIDDLAPPAP